MAVQIGAMGAMGAQARDMGYTLDPRNLTATIRNEGVLLCLILEELFSKVAFLARILKLGKAAETICEGKEYRLRLGNCLSVIGVTKFVFGDMVNLSKGTLKTLQDRRVHLPSVAGASDTLGDAVSTLKFFGVVPPWAGPVSTGADVIYYAAELYNKTSVSVLSSVVRGENISNRNISMEQLTNVVRIVCSLAVAVFKALEFFYAASPFLVASSTVAMTALVGAVAGVATSYLKERERVSNEVTHWNLENQRGLQVQLLQIEE